MSVKTCFVVCPIGEKESEILKNANLLFEEIIEPACKVNDLAPIRSDHPYDTDYVDQTVFDYLDTAELVIADLTGRNANVFLEVGYRLALKTPIILMTRDDLSTLPFDIRNRRVINYELTLGAHRLAIDALSKTIETALLVREPLDISIGSDIQVAPGSPLFLHVVGEVKGYKTPKWDS